MSDTPDTGTAEDEKKAHALLALLYPEPGDSLDTNSEAVSDTELGEMQSLRALFRELPEEEPSHAVSTSLLAMAAQHAPVPQAERRGLFAWLGDVLMPLMAHPGLAAAATLFLVVGVAGTLYVKGNAKLAKPVATSSSPAPSAAPFVPSVPVEEAVADPGTVDVGESTAEALEAKDEAGYGYGDGKTGVRKNEDTKAPQTSKTKGRAERLDKNSSGATSGLIGRGAKKKSKSAPAPSKPRARREAASSPQVQAPAPVRSLKVDLADEEYDAPEQDAEEPPPEPSAAVTLHSQALRALAKNNCTLVNQLANKIRKLDSTYYDRVFLADDRLKACRSKKQSSPSKKQSSPSKKQSSKKR